MNAGDENRRLGKQDLHRKSFSLRNRRDGTEVDFRKFSELRHAKQLEAIKAANIEPEERMLLLSKFEKGVYLTGNPLEPKYCCIFNVIIAFEWNPDYYELELLRNACDEAAYLFFDATDGYMTFNRIIIGGPELMKCADIQIFASNRLFPRAWVNGLHIEEKYQPIRIGRGYWRKKDSRAEPWHKGLGAAVLVHEWLHYAVGMKDDYVKPFYEVLPVSGYTQTAMHLVSAFERSKLPAATFALPDSSPAVNTLMANLESSELLGQSEWNQLAENVLFQWLNIPPEHQVENIPPDESTVPLFNVIGTAKEDSDGSQQVWLNWDEADLDGKLDPSHCWVFILIGEDGADIALDKPKQLIAQGSYEKLPEGYRIMGAQKDACIILIGHASKRDGTPDPGGEPKVLYNKISGINGRAMDFWNEGWQDATPEGGWENLPLVSIATKDSEPSYTIDVNIVDDERKWSHMLFPLGDQQAKGDDALESLDGHVLLVSRNSDKYQLMIVNFSIGGCPGSGYPANPNPVPAGSSDGNAMIFFYDKKTAQKRAPSKEDDVTSLLSSLRIITTTNLLGPTDTKSPIGHGPRSYTFAVMPNKQLPVDNDGLPLCYPTLVLYFDGDTKGDWKEATLKIHRLAEGKWDEIPDQSEKTDSNLVAARLNSDTARGLFSDPPTPEYYRMFLIS